MTKDSKLVYSTDPNYRTKTKVGSQEAPVPAGQQILYLRRETKGRKGKGVTIISGLILEEKSLKALAKKLKQLCGTGGTIKEGEIEIQGDHRDTLGKHLVKDGYKVKVSGG